MNLGQLIEILKTINPDKEVEGFGNPHSYRGSYDELAFEPMNTTVGQMLKDALSAVGESYTGYKGGSFEMTENTLCYVAYEGCTGTPITKAMLAGIVW